MYSMLPGQQIPKVLGLLLLLYWNDKKCQYEREKCNGKISCSCKKVLDTEIPPDVEWIPHQGE